MVLQILTFWNTICTQPALKVTLVYLPTTDRAQGKPTVKNVSQGSLLDLFLSSFSSFFCIVPVILPYHGGSPLLASLMVPAHIRWSAVADRKRPSKNKPMIFLITFVGGNCHQTVACGVSPHGCLYQKYSLSLQSFLEEFAVCNCVRSLSQV